MRIRTAALFRAACAACAVTVLGACDKCGQKADGAGSGAAGATLAGDAGVVLLPDRGEDATEGKVRALEKEIEEDDRLEPSPDAGL